MSVNKNNLSDIADYHEKIKFFEELFNLDYNPTEMLVTVERMEMSFIKNLQK
ncbi:Uncharacterised protein [Streptococcus pneumoniae]|nr:Uncharacterised protein [Streptococcus pneumoniae]